MVRSFAILVLGLAVLLHSGCKKDEQENVVNPDISFRTDSGYTYQNSTAGPQDTIAVGVKVVEGSRDLRSFKVSVHYDGQTLGHTLDSISYSGSPFTYSGTWVLRDQSGTERYAFSVLDQDGNTITRALTITVQ